MTHQTIYVTIGHEGRGDDYHNEVMYAGNSKEEASDIEFLESMGFNRVEMQVWKSGLHIRTLDTDRDRRYTNWTREFDLEIRLEAEQEKVLQQADEIKRQLTIIKEGGEDL